MLDEQSNGGAGSSEIAALAERVATARGKLPLQHDAALVEVLSEDEIAAERELAEWIRQQRRGQRRRAVQDEIAAEKRNRRTSTAIKRVEEADARWHRRALAARRRVANQDARLAQLYRRAEWSSRALIGVVVLGMVWAGVNVQHNLVPSGDMSDPLYWLSYGIEAMISIPIITIMVVATTAARWGRELPRGKIVFFEIALLGTTIGLNAGPHLAAGHWGKAAEYSIAPVMVGVVIWLHAWVSARYAQLIDSVEVVDDSAYREPPNTGSPQPNGHSHEPRNHLDEIPLHRLDGAVTQGLSTHHLPAVPQYNGRPATNGHHLNGANGYASAGMRPSDTNGYPSTETHPNGHGVKDTFRSNGTNGYAVDATFHTNGANGHAATEAFHSNTFNGHAGDHTIHPKGINGHTGGEILHPDGTNGHAGDRTVRLDAANGHAGDRTVDLNSSNGHAGNGTRVHPNSGSANPPTSSAARATGTPVHTSDRNGYEVTDSPTHPNQPNAHSATDSRTHHIGHSATDSPARHSNTNGHAATNPAINSSDTDVHAAADSRTRRSATDDHAPTETRTRSGNTNGNVPTETHTRSVDTTGNADAATRHNAHTQNHPADSAAAQSTEAHTSVEPEPAPRPARSEPVVEQLTLDDDPGPEPRHPRITLDAIAAAREAVENAPEPLPIVEPDEEDGVWAVARAIIERRLSKLPVEQVAEILTLADQSWTPTGIGSEVGISSAAVSRILEAARKLRNPYALAT
ncbi:hypothetical protein ACWDYH_30810 [Nocardia goodfellowii]